MEQLPTADNFGQGYGYVLYSREIKIENSKIQLSNLRKSIKANDENSKIIQRIGMHFKMGLDLVLNRKV